jgi:hypothetical protein
MTFLPDTYIQFALLYLSKAHDSPRDILPDVNQSSRRRLLELLSSRWKVCV